MSDHGRCEPIPGTLTPARAHRLCALLEVTPGAIVSRALTQGSAGSLTFFAFDRGQELAEHTSPYDAYVLVVEGEAELRVNSERIVARAGDLVLMPAGAPHGLSAREPFKMLLAMIRNPRRPAAAKSARS